MPTAGAEGLVAMPWGGFTQGSSLLLVSLCAVMGLGAELGTRGSEVWQWGPCGRALVPTQTFPVEVSGPVFLFQGELWHHGEGFLPAVPTGQD